jgi:hypothetical protein
VITELQKQPDVSFSLLGFGQDASGEIYALGTQFVEGSLTGVILKLAPSPPG